MKKILLLLFVTIMFCVPSCNAIQTITWVSDTVYIITDIESGTTKTCTIIGTGSTATVGCN